MTTLLTTSRGAFLIQWSAKILQDERRLDAEAKETLELKATFENVFDWQSKSSGSWLCYVLDDAVSLGLQRDFDSQSKLPHERPRRA